MSELKKKTAHESAGPCPVCGGDDRFYVHDGKGFCRQCNTKGGDIVDWHCLKEGLDVAGLLKKYSISGNGKAKPTSNTRPEIVKTYDYTDASGNLVFQVCRMEPKSFRQRRPDGNGSYIWNLQGVTPTIYRLPEVIGAQEVIVVEGEKDCDNLSALGFLATTVPGGAGKWREHYNQYLKGKRVVIIPDNDEPGRKHAAQVAQSLEGIAESIKILSLPELPESGDVSDFLATFEDPTEATERLALMIEGAEPYTAENEPAEKTPPIYTPPTKAAMRIDPAELTTARLSPPCIVQDYLYCDVGTLTAPGGTGKTTLQLYEMVCIALARPLYGLDVLTPGWCLYVTAEDSRETLIARLREIMQALELTNTEQQTVIDRAMFWDVTGEQRRLIEVRDGNIELTALADEIITAYKADPPVMMIFDPVVSFGASEGLVNDNEQGLVTAGRRIVRGLGCCVRFITHTGKANARNKTTDQYTSRGGTALPDGGRMTAVMQPWHPDDARKLPPGLTCSGESSISILARPKLSLRTPQLAGHMG